MKPNSRPIGTRFDIIILWSPVLMRLVPYMLKTLEEKIKKNVKKREKMKDVYKRDKNVHQTPRSGGTV